MDRIPTTEIYHITRTFDVDQGELRSECGLQCSERGEKAIVGLTQGWMTQMAVY